ncbi:MAG: hypothetical protein ACPLRY_07460 [Candidatus Bathyarchaeales archaeon]
MREKMMKKKFAVMLLFLLLCMSVTKLSHAQSEQYFTATPDNSNITHVVGSGFDPSEIVSLKLLNATTGEEVYAFPENIMTDENGNFSGIVIIPTSIHGTFNITASTSTVQLSIEFTVPDLTGPQGPQGPQGETGPQGPQGELGESADVSLIYGSYGLAIVALLIAIAAMLKKPR